MSRSDEAGKCGPYTGKQATEKALEGAEVLDFAHKDFTEAAISMFNELKETMSKELKEAPHQIENINQEIEIIKMEIIALKGTLIEVEIH